MSVNNVALLGNVGRAWCDFVSYDDRFEDSGKHLFIVRYERDDEYIAFIEDEVKKFLAEVDNLVAEFNRHHTYQQNQLQSPADDSLSKTPGHDPGSD